MSVLVIRGIKVRVGESIFSVAAALAVLVCTQHTSFGQLPDLTTQTLQYNDVTSSNVVQSVAEDAGNEKEMEFGDYDNDGDLDVVMAVARGDFSQRRNKLYRNDDGVLVEVSGSSVIPEFSLADVSRGALFRDFDNDGWVDLGIVSPNHPRFRIVSNKIGKLKESNGFVEVSLVGGQTSAEPSTVWSSRDAIGASILATAGDCKRRFLLSCGEGLSSQNSKRIHIGLGETKVIDSIEVSWPSGKKTIQKNVKAGQRVTIFENQESL